MWLKALCYSALVLCGSRIGLSQNAERRVYEDVIYRNDSSHVLSYFHIGGSLGLQYNSSIDAPLLIGQEVNGVLTGSIFEYGSTSNGAGDFNLFPELSLVADGLFHEHWRYRVQAAFGEYGFDWSDGSSSQEPYYRNSTSALALKLGGGYKLQEIYCLLNLGFGSYLQASHGIGASPSPATVKSEASSALFSWGFTFGQEIGLSNNSIFLLPEIYYSNNIPVNHPTINFIPQTYSLGVRLNVEFPFKQEFPQTEERREYIYASGNVRDCKTDQPIEAEVTALDVERNESLSKHTTGPDGAFLFRLDTGKSYRFVVRKEGYYADSVFIATNSKRDYELPAISLKSVAHRCKESEVFQIEGHIASCGNGSSIKAHVRIVDTSSKFVLAETETDESGNYHATLGKSGTFEIEVDANGYFPHDELVSAGPKNESRKAEIVLCDSINLESYFDIDRYNLNSEALPHIDRIAEYLKKNPRVHIAIEGHTDNTGTRNHNMMLSTNRAQTLKSYLLSKGVNDRQIESVAGYGPDQPISDNATEKGRERNRRVDLKVVKR